MSVILKGMEMPDECMNCEFGVYGFNFSHCQLKDHGRIISQKCIDNAIRPDWCPLVEIPEGARLIDVNRLKAVFDKNVTSAHAFDVIFDNAPTVFKED